MSPLIGDAMGGLFEDLLQIHVRALDGCDARRFTRPRETSRVTRGTKLRDDVTGPPPDYRRERIPFQLGEPRDEHDTRHTTPNTTPEFNSPVFGQWQQSMFPMGFMGWMMATAVLSEAAVETSAMEAIAMVAAMTRRRARAPEASLSGVSRKGVSFEPSNVPLPSRRDHTAASGALATRSRHGSRLRLGVAGTA
jgi:hypothetical protein